ncbi:MAG: RDD family protein [Roseburia sp.]|nr:RDD family protein [Anaeroplasma bactoclasticum]MCM1196057.1 RDD family protein [Roseburia sp.]MCM1556742.1 RDD family protein [Anaeroplasma bactoclasticum]
MKYLNARSSQRFIAFLIDSLLISIVVGFILGFIPAYNESTKVIIDFYKLYMEGEFNDAMYQASNVLKHAGIILGLQLLMDIPIYILYLVVLPYFWNKQTLGRWAMHLKVVSKNENKATPLNLILRELVGGMLLLRLLSSSIIIPILYWYFSATTGRSLADMIGGTRLVDTLYINEEYADENQSKEREYVDASFTEVPNEPKEDPAEEDSEYKVF